MPHQFISYEYGLAGSTNRVTHGFHFEWGGVTFSDQRTLETAFNPLGLTQQVRLGDTLDPSLATTATYDYDDQGLPNGLAWKPALSAVTNTVTWDRNTPGMPTQRRLDDGVRVHDQRWTYDIMGRVDTMTAQRQRRFGGVARA